MRGAGYLFWAPCRRSNQGRTTFITVTGKTASGREIFEGTDSQGCGEEKLYAKECPVDTFSIEEKKEFLHAHHIALWDVIARCGIAGSSDSSIKNVVPNDIGVILKNASIENIYVNGGKAYELYMRCCYPLTGREAVKLPSTSPANAAWTLDRLIKTWNTIKK